MNVSLSRALCLGIFATLGLGLTACTSSPKMSQSDRAAVLERFVGQPSEVIYAQLDLSSLGYAHINPPTLSPNQLSYTVDRPLSIPLTSGNVSAVPIPYSVNSSNGYETNLQCQIVFHLENNIAQSMSYTKRTC